VVQTHAKSAGRGLRMKRGGVLVWISVAWFATLCGVLIWLIVS
jgi:hypothetical protein